MRRRSVQCHLRARPQRNSIINVDMISSGVFGPSSRYQYAIQLRPQSEQAREFGVAVDDATVFDTLSDKSDRGGTDARPPLDDLFLFAGVRESTSVDRTGANLAEEAAHVGLQVEDKLIQSGASIQFR